MLKEITFLVEDDPEGGFTAKALGEDIFTEGDDLDDLKHNIKDALRCHFGDVLSEQVLVRLRIVKEEEFSYA